MGEACDGFWALNDGRGHCRVQGEPLPLCGHRGDTALCLLGMTRRADALAAELAEVRERLRLAEEDAVGIDHAVVSVLRGRAGSYTMLSVAHAAHEERLHPAAEPKEATP